MKTLLSFSLTPQRDTFLKVLMPYFNKHFSKIWHLYKYHKRFLVSLLAPVSLPTPYITVVPLSKSNPALEHYY